MECPHCGSGVVAKKGFSYTKHKPVAKDMYVDNATDNSRLDLKKNIAISQRYY